MNIRTGKFPQSFLECSLANPGINKLEIDISTETTTMPHPYFSHAALAVALLPGLFGLNALLRPEATLAGAQIPVPPQPEPRKLARTLMRFFGVRNIAISYLLTLVWSSGNERLVGLSLFAGIWMSISDGLISRWQIGGGEWNHWFLIPFLVGSSAGLLGAFN